MVNDFVTYNQKIIIVTKTCAVIRLVSSAYQIDIEKLNPPIKKINGGTGEGLSIIGHFYSWLRGLKELRSEEG